MDARFCLFHSKLPWDIAFVVMSLVIRDNLSNHAELELCSALPEQIVNNMCWGLHAELRYVTYP